MARERASWLRLVFAAAPFVVIAGMSASAFPSGEDDHAKHAEPPAPAKGEPKDHGDKAPAPEKSEGKPKARPALDDEHDNFSSGSHRVDAPKPAPKGGEGEPGPERAPKRSAAGPSDAPMDADAALKALKDGNARWAGDRTENPNTGASRRETLARDGQKPFAAVLTCADSRLPVERVFDRGVGELFVVRVAGNIAGTSETGTLEYGVEHLHIPLLVVMGHTKCGAVAAAASHANPSGALGELVRRIAPAVERAEGQMEGATPEAVTAAAIRENVWQTIFDLLRYSPEIRTAISEGRLKVVGAVCEIGSGKVEFMGEHPWQDELVAAFSAKAGGRATADAAGKGGSDAHEPQKDEGH
jgi:carbonic anhydrase